MPRWSRLNKLKHTLHQDVSITYSILNERCFILSPNTNKFTATLMVQHDLDGTVLYIFKT